MSDPGEITARSFEIIQREAHLETLPEQIRTVAARMIHACGMVDLRADLVWRGEVMAAGRAALAAARPILADGKMTVAGIARARLPAGVEALCTVADAAVAARALALGCTRSAAGVEAWLPHLDGAVVAIGNAPTALFRLLDGLAGGWPRPALIVAVPVGFVGAAESKQRLAETDTDIPFVTVRGRRGGSAIAAAAINALFLGEDAA